MTCSLLGDRLKASAYAMHFPFPLPQMFEIIALLVGFQEVYIDITDEIQSALHHDEISISKSLRFGELCHETYPLMTQTR